MKPNYPAQEQKEFDIVQIGRPFRLFEHAYTTRHKLRKEKLFELYRYIYLESGNMLPRFPIAISVVDFSYISWSPYSHLIIPYTNKSQEEEIFPRRLVQEHPYRLSLTSAYEDFCASGIATDLSASEPDGNAFPPTFRSSFLKVLCHLRFQVSFNDLPRVYEARPKKEIVEEVGELFLARFYPLATGNTSLPPDRDTLGNGDPLHLPPQPKKLQQAWGKFSFAATPVSIV